MNIKRLNANKNMDNYILYVFLQWKCVTFVEKPLLKIINFQNYKRWYLIPNRSNKVFKCTVVNLTLPSVHGGSLEVTLFPSIRIKLISQNIFYLERRLISRQASLLSMLWIIPQINKKYYEISTIYDSVEKLSMNTFFGLSRY